MARSASGASIDADLRFKGLLEAASDATVIVDSAGRITLVNAQAEHLFGYAHGELVGELVEVLIPQAARAVHASHRERYLVAARPRAMGAGGHLEGRRRDGSVFPAEISLSSIETDEGRLVAAAVRDISLRLEADAERDRLRTEAEQERLERRVQQSQRLESLGLLAGGIAHDFNNLLAVILVYAGMVEEQIEQAHSQPDGKRWATAVTDIGQIKQAAERATSLTRQLLAFGRREVVQPRLVNLNDVITEVEIMLRRTLGDHVTVVIELGQDLAPVMADPGQIEQVLINLGVNSRDAMPRGGTLTITTDTMVIGDAHPSPSFADAPAGRYSRLRVSDSGMGMTRDIVEHAFEPFFTTKPSGSGTGLGLSTVHGIVSQAGGFVDIRSRAGSGTTASVIIPAANGAATHNDGPAPSRPPSRGEETVLIVDDEAAIREVSRRILSRNGYRVITAADGPEAIAISSAYDGPIDLLVTDVVMPRMLGSEVAQQLTRLRPGLRVLYVSGYAHPVLASQGTLEPGVMLLEKPFSEADMLVWVRAALEASFEPMSSDAAQHVAPSVPDVTPRPIRVLVIDDQEMVAQTFERILEAAGGIRVVAVAGTAASGVRAAAEHMPDVVILDQLLPDATGTSIVPAILQRAPGARIVMASGREDPQSREAALAAGCAGFVEKSTAARTLVAAVRMASSRP